MTIGQRIKAVRKSIGMTQDELGKKLGVSGAAIAQYETGRRNPKYETLQRIANALHTNLSALTGQMLEDGIVSYPVSYPVFSVPRVQMNAAFDRLNPEGQQIAIGRIAELTEIPRYRRQEGPQSSPASPEGPATTPPLSGPETPPEGA